MSRSNHWIGLHKRATKFVLNECTNLGEYKEYEGAWDEMYPLFHYQDNKTKVIYYEVIQAVPWSSGPHFFTTLESMFAEKPYKFKWRHKEMMYVTGDLGGNG